MALKRFLWMCVVGCSLAQPAAASGDSSRMLAYLTGSSADDAADYLAFLIRAFGCEVQRNQRQVFQEVVIDHLAFDFGVSGIRGTEGAGIPKALREGLFAFSYRAGPQLMERGELEIDSEGNSRLLTCNSLIS
jgi:hypothetical protein